MSRIGCPVIGFVVTVAQVGDGKVIRSMPLLSRYDGVGVGYDGHELRIPGNEEVIGVIPAWPGTFQLLDELRDSSMFGSSRTYEAPAGISFRSERKSSY